MSDDYGFSFKRVAMLVAVAGALAGGPFLVKAFGAYMVGFIILLCLVYCVPTALLIGAIYGRGRFQVFCQGALVPIAIQSVSGSLNGFLKALDWDTAMDRGVINGALESLGILSLIMGLVAVGIHALIVRLQAKAALGNGNGERHTAA